MSNNLKEDFKRLWKEGFFTENEMHILKKFFYLICEVTAPEFSKYLGYSHFAPVNAIVGKLGKKIAQKLNLPLRKRKDETYAGWDVFLDGKMYKNSFQWLLKEPFVEALRELGNEEMRTIEDKEELKSNLSQFEMYLHEGSEEDRQEAKKLLARGKHFVSYKVNDEWRFAPSRFIGYFDNSLKKHLNNPCKDGRITDKEINKISDGKPQEDKRLEDGYLKYCKKLGVIPNKKKRKYWRFDFKAEDFFDNINDIADEEFPEGKLIEIKHKRRERDPKLTKRAKQAFKAKHGRLFCQVCGFDFEKTYGNIGEDFIEAHHTVPLSEMEEDHKTKIEDIAMVCSNCHKMIHRKRPWLSIDRLNAILKGNN